MRVHMARTIIAPSRTSADGNQPCFGAQGKPQNGECARREQLHMIQRGRKKMGKRTGLTEIKLRRDNPPTPPIRQLNRPVHRPRIQTRGIEYQRNNHSLQPRSENASSTWYLDGILQRFSRCSLLHRSQPSLNRAEVEVAVEEFEGAGDVDGYGDCIIMRSRTAITVKSRITKRMKRGDIPIWNIIPPSMILPPWTNTIT